ncbi:AI-2E family transporter [Pontixanthobacter sp. CEM42]|uniref:AI-2E family transporter n=1 Tax=Pontixanthobacter sp. CEM42 TaxID=2792077 RepID=UPI001AE027E8|nr:AI-2E family transporter [Pontixanthobacter sp. CEM42]
MERGGFVLFLALITAGFIVIVWPFASPLLWSALAAIMFQPLYQWLLPRCRDSANKAAIAALLIITFAVVIPALLIGSMIIEQAAEVFLAFRDGQFDVGAWFTQVFSALPASIQSSLDTSGFGTLNALIDRAQDFARESTGIIARQAVAIGGSALSFVLSFGVGLYVTYFLLRDGKQIGRSVINALPMEREIADDLAEKFLTIVRATIKGSVVVGLVQGTLGAITFWIAGVPSVMLLGLLMAIFSLLPALGPAIVWLPIAIYLLATGAIWQGIFVIAAGVLVIGMADNVLRPILVGRDTGIPDWIILISTLGGIGLLGLSGIVVGPLVAGLFLAAWSISKGDEEPPKAEAA